MRWRNDLRRAYPSLPWQRVFEVLPLGQVAAPAVDRADMVSGKICFQFLAYLQKCGFFSSFDIFGNLHSDIHHAFSSHTELLDKELIADPILATGF
jgi:hypothetical protein